VQTALGRQVVEQRLLAAGAELQRPPPSAYFRPAEQPESQGLHVTLLVTSSLRRHDTVAGARGVGTTGERPRTAPDGNCNKREVGAETTMSCKGGRRDANSHPALAHPAG
jgi:hypothetical protein